MFTAPAMCEALRQLSPGSVPDQLRQAELSMRERERDGPVDRRGGCLPRKRISPLGLRAHVQGAPGTQLPLEAGRASAHTRPLCREPAGDTVSALDAQSCRQPPCPRAAHREPFQGLLGDNRELFVHSPQGTGTLPQALSAFPPINYRMEFT